MAKQEIGMGSGPLAGDGESLHTAFTKVNENFTELYGLVGTGGNLNLGAFEFNGSILTTTDSSAIIIDQATTVTSDLTIGGDFLPSENLRSTLGSPTKQFHSIYVGTGSVYIGDAQLSLEGGKLQSSVGFNLTGSIGEVSGAVEWDNVLNKPTIPTSFDRLVNGAYTLGLGADGALNLPSSGGESGSIKSSVNNINLAVTDINGDRSGVYLSQEAALVYGADRTIIRSNSAADLLDWTFGTDGSLTIPGDIRSEGNINIDINLADSTLRRWQFGEDGALTLPNGSTIGDGEAGVGVPITTARGTILLGNLAECAGGESHFHIMKSGQQAIDLFLGNDSNYVKLPSTGGVEIATQNFNQYSWIFSTDGSLQIPGDIRSEGNINIDVNLSDSTLRRWQFGEDGDLILPAGGDILDSTGTSVLGGGGAAGPVQPYLELTNSPFMVLGVILGTPVSFTRTAEGSQTDAIAPGLRLARGAIGALYNAEVEQSYDQNTHAQPTGTEWNADGWGNLVGLATRTYTTFYEALNGAVGNNIIGAELVMHDTIDDQYYKFSFSNWGGNNGGSYAYTRTLIERDPNYFKKENYATANNVDVIEDDSTLQIGITRDNNQGIYNPFTEEEWDEDVSPDGTEWNIDGWDDLTDVETRTYTTFYNAYDGNVGQNILGSKAVMYVASIDKYYAIQWLSWTQNNAG
jgi:hypothetical protein